MPSTYTVNLGIEKPATGEQSGTWGDTTNVNFDILDQAINGAERVTLTSAGSSGSPNALNITNGATSDGRNKWIEFYSSGDLGGSAYVQLVPDDAEKIVFIRNSLASSRSVLLFQGTYNSGRDLEIPAGVDMVVKFDGGGASAATVTDVFTKLRATEITTPTLTATTADINGGTIDNSVIGGSTAAAVTGTTVVANTSLNIAGDGATVTGIKDEDDMSSNSATKLATQQSIKAYVDSQVGTVDTWAEVLANGATSGSTNPEVTAGQALKTNTINETSAGSGVTIDSVLLKDDVVNATDIETGSISANDGTAAATIANSTGNFTITNFISNSVDIGGGAIDGTNIGASSRATGDFTTFSTNGATTIGGAAKFTADVDTASSGGLELKIGKIAATPSDATDAFVAIHDTGGPGALAGDLVLVPRSSNTVANAVRLYSGYTTPVERLAVARLESVINDPGNDYDFRVESNNNANMLFVDAGSDHVNIGTGTDFGDTFNVSGTGHFTGAVTLSRQSNDTGSTGLVFEKTRSTSVNGNTVVQNGDQLGYVKFTGNDGDQFIDGAYVISFVDGTPGNNDMPASLQFWTTADGASSPTARMVINNKGSVGIGVADGDVTNDGTAARTYVGIIGTANRGRLNLGTTASNGADAGTLSFTNGANELVSLSVDTTSGVQNTGTLFVNSTRSIKIQAAASDEVVLNEGSLDVDFRVESNNLSSALFVDGANGNVTLQGATTTIGSNAASTNVELNLNGVASKAQRIQFQESGTNKWLLGQGAASETSAFELYNAGGVIALSVDRTSNIATFQRGAVFNEGGADSDFRIESDNSSHMLFVDASTDRVGVGVAAPNNTFDAQSSDTNAVRIRGVNNLPLYSYHDSSGVGWATGPGSSYSELIYMDPVNDKISIYAGGSQKAAFGTSDIVFNESSNDIDFRVESSGVSNMLNVDAGNDAVGVRYSGWSGSSLSIKSTSSRNNITLLEDENVGDGSYTPFYQYKVAYIAGNSSNTQLTIPFNARSYNQTGYLKIRVLPALHNLSTPSLVATAEFALTLAYSTTVSVGATLSSSGNFSSATGNSSNQLILTFSSAYSNATMSGAFVHIEFFGQQGSAGAPDWANIAFN